MEASDLVSTLRARVAWQLIVVAGILHVPLTMNALRTLHNEQVWRDFDVDMMRNGLLERGIVQVLFRTTLLLLLTLRGHCSCNQLHMFQVCVYCELALRLWFTSDILHFVEMSAVSVLQRVSVAFVIGNVPLTMVLNAAYFSGMFARVISSSLMSELQYLLRMEVATGVVTVCISALFESLLFRQMRATLEASLATESERTARELLSLVCDAVVTLDDGLIITKPSAHLAALLFTDTAQGLCGVDFVELVCDGDGDRFQASMTGGGQTQCLHLHLRDTNGTSLAVQLFRSCLRGGLGQTLQLLGIREEEDGERTAAAASRCRASQRPHRRGHLQWDAGGGCCGGSVFSRYCQLVQLRIQ